MMRRRKRLLLALVGVVAVLGVLALPAVHWRLIGWARGEPFYRGRPVSYWRGEIGQCDPWCPCILSTGLDPIPCPAEWIRRQGRVEEFVCWLAGRMGVLKLAAAHGPSPPLADCDPPAVPVLVALLGDPDPKVRYFAVDRLAALNEAARPALPLLRGMASDRAVIIPAHDVVPDITVAHAVRDALSRIDPDAWEAAGRP